MKIIKYTMETTATPAQIWQVLQDVEKWNDWDHDLESSGIDGSFQTGTPGYIKPKKGPVLKTLLTHVEPLKIFIQEATLFFARVIMTHSIHQASGKTYITFDVEIRGPLAIFYALFLGASIKKKVPIEMEEMLKKATFKMSK